MSDKKSTIEAIEDKIKQAARDAEHFADEVTADEVPPVIVRDDDGPTAKTSDTPKKPT